jgi:beta-N-acetylhexosaminidase
VLVVAGLALAVARLTGARPPGPVGPTGSVTAQPSRQPGQPPAGNQPQTPVNPGCAALVANMPLRAKLAQRLMVGVEPSQPGSARTVVANDQVGGIFIGGNSTAILRGDALAQMRSIARTPVAVAIDEEGGRVQRIKALDGSIPSARTMAATMTPTQVRALAAKRGQQLRALGVTVDIAPVLDVSSQPADSVIGDRSFSTDPARVVAYAGAFAAGLRDAGVLPVFKHFPGHGRATGDSHAGAVSTPPLAALRTDDLLPYHQLLGSGPAAVMVGHLDVPGLTDKVPASLSPAAYQLLRTEFGFTGVTMTDDLGAMKAITNTYDLPTAVLTALRAGADIALWTSTEDLPTILAKLQAAAANGQLSAQNVDQSTTRILAAKGVCTG